MVTPRNGQVRIGSKPPSYSPAKVWAISVAAADLHSYFRTGISGEGIRFWWAFSHAYTLAISEMSRSRIWCLHSCLTSVDGSTGISLPPRSHSQCPRTTPTGDRSTLGRRIMLSSQNKKLHDSKNKLHRALQFSKWKTVKITFIQYFKGFKVHLLFTKMRYRQSRYYIWAWKRWDYFLSNIKYSAIIWLFI